MVPLTGEPQQSEHPQELQKQVSIAVIKHRGYT